MLAQGIDPLSTEGGGGILITVQLCIIQTGYIMANTVRLEAYTYKYQSKPPAMYMYCNIRVCRQYLQCIGMVPRGSLRSCLLPAPYST